MILAWAAGLLLTAVWCFALYLSERDRMKGSRSEPKERLLAAPFKALLHRSGLLDRFQPLAAGLHGRLLLLNGSTWSAEASRGFIAEAVGFGFLAMWSGAWLGVLSGEPLLFSLGLLLGIVVPAAKWKDVAGQVTRRKQDIVLLLPEVLGKLMLLLGAGETLQRALVRCAERSDEEGQHPLLLELRRVNESVRNGESFAAAMEVFSRRCGVQEVSVFTTTLLLNYRRGGDRLVLSLKELSYSLWEKRKAVVRARGEEASSKLVFPLVGIFFVLMVLVASPAILMMRG
ncbi:type II secretion system F family protein [Paenibacillus sacheonensis]|uniref:Type II secretion protein F n=1 Tax=Paenibacillus sacheonensis TaxID=742054 RepID=A0A7X4YS75_9BACL|nr:type II secretion system F family protein [Paenibacillus sacheonensis]MBM7566941.1 tight adherence protein C [Paenibacillus sacheonensis]NBC71563.1 type II secretion protein F [Paenibacillus sacheonensis]